MILKIQHNVTLCLRTLRGWSNVAESYSTDKDDPDCKSHVGGWPRGWAKADRWSAGTGEGIALPLLTPPSGRSFMKRGKEITDRGKYLIRISNLLPIKRNYATVPDIWIWQCWLIYSAFITGICDNNSTQNWAAHSWYGMLNVISGEERRGGEAPPLVVR